MVVGHNGQIGIQNVKNLMKMMFGGNLGPELVLIQNPNMVVMIVMELLQNPLNVIQVCISNFLKKRFKK